MTATGHDAIHTLDLPRGNLTPDDDLCERCARENRILISKDAEFAYSFLLRREPPRLLLVLTGNITNEELQTLFASNLAGIVKGFDSSAFIELDRTGMTIRA
jgi:predicted nuclease of predicted toxin-antitoxin system